MVNDGGLVFFTVIPQQGYQANQSPTAFGQG